MNSPKLQSLYQQVILEHHRRPRNRGEMDGADATVHMNNPTCGDEITLQLKVRDGRVEEARFGGQGCAISQASASMMTELLRGKSFPDVDALTERFIEMVHGSADAAADRSLGELRALSGVAKFPTRVRCALLAWNALDEARRGITPA